jgi:GT2 family glycosyltransferase
MSEQAVMAGGCQPGPERDYDGPDISVCIVNWNTRELLRACIRSIFEQSSGLAAELVVVDNASTDGSQEMIAQAFPEVTLVANRENRGFGAANNQAAEIARGRIVLFLNSDTLVLPAALASMVRYLDQHEQVGAVGCKLLNGDGSLQRSCWRGFLTLRAALVEALYLWRLMPRSGFVRGSDVAVDQTSAPIAVDHLLGACMAVPRRVLDEVGTFDTRFFMFLEETDLCYRIKQAGYEIHYLPDAAIIHFGGKSTSQVPTMRRVLYQSQLTFLRKHGVSFAYILSFKTIATMAALVRMALWTGRLLRGPQRRHAASTLGSYAALVAELPSY